MFSFRRAVATLAFISLVSGVAAFGQDSSTSQPTQEQTPAPQAPAAQGEGQKPGPVSVQGRIRARREARRVQAIRDTYSQRYELFIGSGYQRFKPGPALQNATMYAFDLGLTRWYNDRLGITIDGRGNYGTAFVGLNFSSITRPAISTYDFMAGPVYRFKLRPKYSIAGRVLGGAGMGNFEADTNGFGRICPPGQQCRLYPDSTTYAFSAAIIGEANLTPSISLRLAPEAMGTGFGSFQRNLGATFGLVYRFGKQ
ncbi:hypothetical protein [Occallatibacter savannae]|uniref:hypothetical protein n=1 Tax=Occallatibacter savannae TaxID=1002691 RepID=UPI000D6873CA|nr:hypothetical protein [Occallatibacter savannae]